MKRSLDSDDEEIDSTKKSKNDDKLEIDNSYYVIRRSRSTVSSSNSDNKPYKFKNDKIDTKFDSKQFGKSDKYSSFNQRDKNRFTPFNKSERNLSSSFHKSSFDKSKSTSSLNDKKIELNSVISNLTSTTGYNIKLPSSFQSNIDKQLDLSPSSSSSSYIIRKSGDNKAKSNELKDQFHSLIKNRNLNYKLEYLVKLTVDGRTIESSNYDSVYDAENEVFSMAIKNLQQITVDESMNDEPNDSIIINEIKQLLRKFDNKLLFKDEIPFEYSKVFKRKIINNWYDQIENNSSFKIERHAGNLASIKLLSD